MSESGDLRKRFPGLLVERQRNGAPRYRVRVEGDNAKRLTIPCGPEHPEFDRLYRQARRGLLPNEKPWMKAGIGSDYAVRSHVSGMLKGAKQRARTSGREFDLTEADVLALMEAQNCCCALSGIQFDLSTGDSRRRPYSPSLDRISAKGGYTKGNVRLLCVVVNLALGDWGDEVLQAVARHIVLHGVPHTSKGVPPEIAVLAEAFETKRKTGPRR
jgi:hypothetical protein